MTETGKGRPGTTQDGLQKTGTTNTSTIAARKRVGTAGEMAYWLRDAMGTGRLAGYFLRADSIVFTPQIGEDGYREAAEDQDDGPAQVRVVTPDGLRSQVQYAYAWYREVRDRKTGEPKLDRHGNEVTVPALFPLPAAQTALGAPDALGLVRPLRGITHTPMVRRDGTILAEPGYDEVTGYLYLPDSVAVQGMRAVPATPSPADLAEAVGLLDEMVAGFPFAGKHDRANYYGLLLTPLLRLIAPPSYKLFAIDAHQPGSGKTLLANLVRHIHGGVFRTEMPVEETELRKLITSILWTTSAPVVVVDNVTGSLKSGALAGLLTSGVHTDRLLGVTQNVTMANDRVWTITGNNVQIGGDLGRRTITVAIDPGQPNPETRTGFAIADLEGWVKANRPRLLWALLAMVASWAAAGRPMQARAQSDGYARWEATVGGILEHAGVPGSFDHPESRNVRNDDEDEQWGRFLAKVRDSLGPEPFYLSELVKKIRQGTPGAPIQDGHEDDDSEAFMDSLFPSDLPVTKLEEQARRGSLSLRSLGRYLGNRHGRWYGHLTVEPIGEPDKHRGQMWRVRTDSEARA